MPRKIIVIGSNEGVEFRKIDVKLLNVAESRNGKVKSRYRLFKVYATDITKSVLLTFKVNTTDIAKSVLLTFFSIAVLTAIQQYTRNQFRLIQKLTISHICTWLFALKKIFGCQANTCLFCAFWIYLTR